MNGESVRNVTFVFPIQDSSLRATKSAGLVLFAGQGRLKESSRKCKKKNRATDTK